MLAALATLPESERMDAMAMAVGAFVKCPSLRAEDLR